jgi:hypothetical protein
VQLLGRISTLAGKSKKVITLPNGVVKAGAWLLRLSHTFKGRESGLEPVSFIDLQTRNTFIDLEDVRLELGYALEDLDTALVDTLEACRLSS